MLERTELLNLRVLHEHKLALRALAMLEGESMSVVLRRLIRQSAQEYGVWPENEKTPSNVQKVSIQN